jgi:hypothetical protein
MYLYKKTGSHPSLYGTFQSVPKKQPENIVRLFILVTNMNPASGLTELKLKLYSGSKSEIISPDPDLNIMVKLL